MNVVIRPATVEDIKAFGERQERTIRAVAVEMDGELVALAGVTIGQGIIEVFSDMKEVKLPKKTIWRYSKMIKDIIASWNLPAIVIADCNKPNACRFIESLGFHYMGEIANEKVYRL